jgi:serine O-acetyltransferase
MGIAETLKADFVVNPRLLDRVSVFAFRLNQYGRSGRFSKLMKIPATVLDLIWLQFIVGSEMPGTVVCGPGLRLPHMGRGVIINGNSVIGSNVTIYHRVTLGVTGKDPMNVPVLGDNVYLGTGAIVIGRVRVGDNASVGAGAVVTKDVLASTTVVGVPASTRPR